MNHSGLAAVPFLILALVANLSSARAESAAEKAAEKEADAYMQAWEERGREACRDNERGCAAAGHALDRAAVDYERAGKLDKAIAIRKMILDPQWHLDYTDYGRAAAFALARNYQAIAEYAEAASLIETAVRHFSKSDEAPSALHEAITLRLGLGEIDRAVDDLHTFAKNYGNKRPANVPKIVVKIATASWGEGRTKELYTFVEKWMGNVDGHGNIHDRALIHALAGRLYAREGATEKAAAEFEIVRALWVRPEEALKQLNGLGGSEDVQQQRLAQTLTVVGEALFFIAEQKRTEAEAIRFPEYTGPGDKASVMAFMNSRIIEWVKIKRAAVESADAEYQKILQLQPAPSPRWAIAAARRVGFLWSAFVRDFRRPPMPKEWQKQGVFPGTDLTYAEMKKSFIDTLVEASEPQAQRGKAAFKACVDFSAKYQYADEHSRACIAWLEKNERKKWIPVEEFTPAPVHMALPIPTSIVMKIP